LNPSQASTSNIGSHLMADFWGCSYSEDVDFWLEMMTVATEKIGATLLHTHIEPFAPNGLTAVAVLAESHIAVHTWPEHDLVAIDIFTCGASVQPELGVDYFREQLAPKTEKVSGVGRGEKAGCSANAAGQGV